MLAARKIAPSTKVRLGCGCHKAPIRRQVSHALSAKLGSLRLVCSPDWSYPESHWGPGVPLWCPVKPLFVLKTGDIQTDRHSSNKRTPSCPNPIRSFRATPLQLCTPHHNTSRTDLKSKPSNLTVATAAAGSDRQCSPGLHRRPSGARPPSACRNQH